MQTLMVYIGMIIQYNTWHPRHRDGPKALVVIAMLAFSSSGQVAMSQFLKITEITTAMATAAYIDVVVDPGILRVRNRSRNRRAMFLVMLTAGCFAGAFAQRAVNSTFAILLCAVGKSIVTVLLLFNRGMASVEC